MSAQLDMFHDLPPEPQPVARARRSDPWTSHEAARSLTPDKLRATQQAVLACFLAAGPMHHDALVREYERRYDSDQPWPRQSESGLRTRTKELVTIGYLRDSGETVRLPSGRKSIVWEAVTE